MCVGVKPGHQEIVVFTVPSVLVYCSLVMDLPGG